MAIALLGIGSNIGDRQANCDSAVEHMKEKGIVLRKLSSSFETEPWGVKDQPMFINMAVEVETFLAPEALLIALKEIEQEMGREVAAKWGPRLIDLDILFYDEMIVDMDDFKIPHPLLHKRAFVLEPLSEIAPGKYHPVFKKTVRQLREGLADGQSA